MRANHLMSSLEQILPKLFSRIEQRDIRPGISRVLNALKQLNFSEQSLGIVIHVAGTNGKGSTAKMISTVLSQKATVGLFTSPHLVYVNERIQINNNPISDEAFATLYDTVKGMQLSFFETVTVIALLYFAQNNVTHTVLEVGMGGRLDATNVIDAPIAVITKIGLDHQQWLGTTKQEIAKEKAGIIKQDARVFITQENRAVQDVFTEQALARNAQITWCENTTHQVSLLGKHQQENAGLAQAVCEHLGCSKNEISTGLLTTSWQGRLQWLTDNILLDVAHNPDGINALATYTHTIPSSITVLFATSNNRSDESLKLLKPQNVVFTQAGPNPTPLENFSFPGKRIPDVQEAFSYAKQQADVLLITGSIFLVGEILKLHQEGIIS